MKHGIENNQEFAHTGDERGLGVLPIRTQPKIESSDGGIAANSRYRRHIQETPDLRAAAPDTTTDAHASTVAIKWCQTGFVGLNIDDPVWDVTVFTKNRERLLVGEIAQGFFNAVVEQAAAQGLLSDRSLGRTQEFQAQMG